MSRVVLLGVRGSGKTVFLSVLSRAFQNPGAFGFSLSGVVGTPTDEHTSAHYRAMLFDKRWPDTTTENEFVHLSWSAKSGTNTMFALDSIDCAGELIVKALAPSLLPPPGSGASTGEGKRQTKRKNADSNSLNTNDSGDSPASASVSENETLLRECVAAADVICLFVNPRDIAAARVAVNATDDALVRHDAMTRLLRTFLDTPAGEGKHIVLAITQSASPGIRRAIDTAGGPRSYLLQNEQFLSTILRFRSVPVLAVSAVNNTGDLDAKGKPTPLLKKDGMDSSGLVEFFLAIGAACSEDLTSLDNALQKVRAAQFTLAKRRHDGNSVKDRLAAAKALREAWDDYVSTANDYLHRHRGNEMVAEWRRDTMAHLDEEERIILRWMVAEPVLDQALRKAADRGDDLVSDVSWQAFRHDLAIGINAEIHRISEQCHPHLEGCLRFCETDNDTFQNELQISTPWLIVQLEAYRLEFMNQAAEAAKADAAMAAMLAEEAEHSASQAVRHRNAAQKHAERARSKWFKDWAQKAMEYAKNADSACKCACSAEKAAREASRVADNAATTAQNRLLIPDVKKDPRNLVAIRRDKEDAERAKIAATDQADKAVKSDAEADFAEHEAGSWADKVSKFRRIAAIAFGSAAAVLVLAAVVHHRADRSFGAKRAAAFALARENRFSEAATLMGSISGLPPFLPRSRYVNETLVRRWENLEPFGQARRTALDRKTSLLADEARFHKIYGTGETRLAELTQSLWPSYRAKRKDFLAALPPDDVDPSSGLPPESLDLPSAIAEYEHASTLADKARADLDTSFARAEDTVRQERAAAEEAARKAKAEKERLARVREARQTIATKTGFPDKGDSWSKAAERAKTALTTSFLQGAHTNALIAAWSDVVAAATGGGRLAPSLPSESAWRDSLAAAQRLKQDVRADEEHRIAAGCADVAAHALAVCRRLNRLRSETSIRTAVAAGLSAPSSLQLLPAAGFDQPDLAADAVETLGKALLAKYPEKAPPNPDGAFWKTLQGDLNAIQNHVLPRIPGEEAGLRSHTNDFVKAIRQRISGWVEIWLEHARLAADKARRAPVGHAQWDHCLRAEQLLAIVTAIPSTLPATTSSRLATIRETLPMVIRVSFPDATPVRVWSNAKDIATLVDKTGKPACVYLSSSKNIVALVHFSLNDGHRDRSVSRCITFDHPGTTESSLSLASISQRQQQDGESSLFR